MERTVTLERTTTNGNANTTGNVDANGNVSSTPLSPGVKFNLEEFLIPEQAVEGTEEIDGMEEAPSGQRKGAGSYTVERTEGMRDEEEPFPPVIRVASPGKSLLGRLRRR